MDAVNTIAQGLSTMQTTQTAQSTVLMTLIKTQQEHLWLQQFLINSITTNLDHMSPQYQGGRGGGGGQSEHGGRGAGGRGGRGTGQNMNTNMQKVLRDQSPPHAEESNIL